MFGRIGRSLAIVGALTWASPHNAWRHMTMGDLPALTGLEAMQSVRFLCENDPDWCSRIARTALAPTLQPTTLAGLIDKIEREEPAAKQQSQRSLR